jgi:hypothetical protein
MRGKGPGDQRFRGGGGELPPERITIPVENGVEGPCLAKGGEQHRLLCRDLLVLENGLLGTIEH